MKIQDCVCVCGGGDSLHREGGARSSVSLGLMFSVALLGQCKAEQQKAT